MRSGSFHFQEAVALEQRTAHRRHAGHSAHHRVDAAHLLHLLHRLHFVHHLVHFAMLAATTTATGAARAARATGSAERVAEVGHALRGAKSTETTGNSAAGRGEGASRSTSRGECATGTCDSRRATTETVEQGLSDSGAAAESQALGLVRVVDS